MAEGMQCVAKISEVAAFAVLVRRTTIWKIAADRK